jgi:hypothetical protein
VFNDFIRRPPSWRFALQYFLVDLLREIDQEARRLGVTRQAFIKIRLADSLAKSH